MKTFVTGDEYGWPGLGYSYGNYVSVRSEIMQRAPRTLLLIFGAATIWLVFGVTIGVLSAVRRRTTVDRAAMGFALFGISAPVFWLGLMALYIVWKKLGLTSRLGLHADRPGSRDLVRPHDPPLDRARPPVHRDLREADPQQPARDARRGLHPDRAREGALGAAR